ncbi:MAG: hypothetical protein K2K97_10520, partial [Muribaculaceae bacterium]|nr:hypothetical protein [Muribaculaceae bacterium]
LYTEQFLSARGRNPWENNSAPGINYTDLEDYLSGHKYATQSWVDEHYLKQHQDLSSYATTKWVEDKSYLVADDIIGKVDNKDGYGLSANDFTDDLLSKLNVIEEGANKYIHPTAGADKTISAATGRVLSSISVDTYGHVTAVGSKTLLATDIPELTINKISGLREELDSKLDADIFNDLFEKVNIGTDSAPVWSIKAKYGLWTEQFLSARGHKPGGNGIGGSGATELRYLSDVLISDGTLAAGQGLVYDGAHWVNQKVGLDPTELSEYLSDNGYTSHLSNTVSHITSAERAKWNATSSSLDTILGSNADNVINKWEEIVAFLDTYTEADTLAGLLSNKADKATTLAGYGITNAYTKTEADGRFLGIYDTAKTAEKLSDGTSYKAWGQTFFKNGLPQQITGNLYMQRYIHFNWYDAASDTLAEKGQYLSTDSSGKFLIASQLNNTHTRSN